MDDKWIRSSVLPGALSRRDFLKLGGGALAGISALSVVGCGGGQSSESGNTITYWASNQGATLQRDEEVLGEQIRRFQEQTGIQVELRVISWENLYNEILTATTSGQGPDVLNIGNTWAAALQATGAFQPFEQEQLEAIGGQDKFVQTAFATAGARGETPTSVPLYGLSYGLFYNRRMFEEEGLEPPETWDKFYEAAERLTKDTDGDGEIDQWGLTLEGANVTENAHWAFILGRQHGGQLFNYDEGNQPTFDSPENVQAVKQYVDFLASDGIVAPNNAEYSDGTQAPSDFATGRAAMLMYQKNAEVNLAENGMEESEYGVAFTPIPANVPEGGAPIMSHTAGINLSIYNNTENREAANEFVRFMTDERQQVELNREFGSLPVNVAAQDAEPFQSEKYELFNRIYTEHSEPMPQIPQEGEMETIMGSAIAELFAQAASSGEPVTEGQVRNRLAAAEAEMPPASQ